MAGSSYHPYSWETKRKAWNYEVLEMRRRHPADVELRSLRPADACVSEEEALPAGGGVSEGMRRGWFWKHWENCKLD